MKKSNKKILSRRGFSIVEVVVALAVVTIITAAMFPLLNSGTERQKQSMRTFESANIAENAIECFRFAGGNIVEFESAFAQTGETLGDGENGYNYIIDKGYYVVAIKIEAEKNTIVIDVKNDKENDSEAINTYSYTIYKKS